MTLSAALRVWVWRNTCSSLGSKAQTSHKHPNSFASDGKAPLAFSLCVLLQQIIPPRPRPFVNYLAGAGDRTETFTGFRTAGRSFGGFAPWSVALSTGTYSSSLCASTQRSMRPPRLISPRPTKSEGNSRRSRKISSRGSTYFAVAILPRRTTSPVSFRMSDSARQSRQRGSGYVGLPGSMSFAAIWRTRSSVTSVSGGSKPASEVITKDPDTVGGGAAKAFAYDNLPRK